MKQHLQSRKFIVAFLIMIALVASACGSDSESKTIELPKTIPASQVAQGGELVLGAEQEPDCLDFIDLCSGSSWGFWMVAINTLPRTYGVERVLKDGKPTDGWEYEKTDLLAKDAVMDTEPVQKITYEINKDAVWSDGVPITGDDFVYTWDQVANGENIYDRTGYRDIKTVEVKGTDKKTVVVTMKNDYAGWQSLFGGNYGVLPSHILKGKDRNALTKDGYTFSGGPFKLVENGWKKEDSITLVRNDEYWGEKAKLDKVTFKVISDTTAQFKAFQDGEVSAIYPQPQLDVVDAINGNGLDDANKIVNAVTGNTEALWLNNEAAPFDSVKVRQALSYSIDRDAVVKALFGDIGVTEALDSFVAPVLPDYVDSSGFGRYKPSESKASSLLKEDGWKKNSKGVFEKNGKKLSFTINTTEGNARRKSTMEVIQKQLEDQGWEVKLKAVSADDLFGDLGPSGDYQAAIFAQVMTTLDPNTCILFCSSNIPTDENGQSGNNWTRTDVPAADKYLTKVETEIVSKDRAEASRNAESALAKDAVSIPLDSLPNILIWDKKVLGPVDENPIQGPFWTLRYWGVKKK